MKNPEDLCHVDYIMYRRQIRQIHRIAQTNNQRPSEVLRLLVDAVLTMQQDVLAHHDEHFASHTIAL